MKKFEGVLFCTDLDGTLYSNDKTVSKENLDAIAYFQSEGGLFTFITGRVPMTSRHICETIRPNAPFGCINGGGIYDPVAQKYLFSTDLPRDVLELVREVDRRLPDVGIQLNTEQTVWFCKMNSTMERFHLRTGLPRMICGYEEVTSPIQKIVFGHDEEETVEALAELLNSHPLAAHFDFIRSERTLYEILPKGVSKGNLLCKLAESLGIDMAKTIAVGDYFNDISMIRAAGLGFAVANAVEDARSVADYVTVSNNESAIAAIIDGLDRGTFRF